MRKWRIMLSLCLALCLFVPGALAETKAGYDLPLSDGEVLKVLIPDLASNYQSLTTQGKEGVEFYFIDLIEDMLGVDLVFEAIPSDYATVLSTRLAANVDMPDIIKQISQADAYKFGQQGVILDLKPFLDKYDTYLEMFLEYEPDAVSLFVSPDGGIYSYSTVLTGYEWADPFGWQLRGDWLEAAGMEYPATIAEWDALFAYWYEHDMNGNGDPHDEIPFTPFGKELRNTLVWMSAWGLAGYNSNGWEVRDGKMFYDYVQPEMKECVKVLADWYQKGYLDADFLNIANVNEKFASNITGASTGYANNMKTRTTLIRQGGAEAAWVTGAEVPHAEGFAGRIDTRLGNTTLNVAITASCKNPDLAFRFLDWIVASPESMILNWFGAEGVHYEGTPNYQNDFWTKTIFEQGYASKDAFLTGNGGRILFPNFRAGSGPWAVFTDAFASGQDQLVQDSFGRIRKGLVAGFPNLQATLDQQDILDEYLPDLTSYFTQTITAFIMGEKDVDAEWDNYVSQMNKLGLPEITQVKQEQYDSLGL